MIPVPSKKKKQRQVDPSLYKTEDELKALAKQQAEEQALAQEKKPPVSEAKKKRENFWYHYKFHTIGAVVGVAMIAFFLRDTLFATKSDFTVVVATGTPVSQESLDSLQAALEAVAEDRNGDNKVQVSLDYIYVPPELSEEELAQLSEEEKLMQGGQQDYATTMKLTTVVAAGIDPIYLVDDHLYEYFQRMATPTELDEYGEPIEQEVEEDATIFLPLDVADATGPSGDRLPFPSTSLAGADDCEPFQEMTFCLRPDLSRKGKEAEYYNYCQDLLLSLAS